jgi:hypothetical protein
LVELAEMRAHRLDMIEQSTSWQATAVLRAAAARLPEAARLNPRRVAKGIYWVLTPHRTPERIKFFRQRRQSERLPCR